MKYCINCGEKYEVGQKFCKSCGQIVEKSSNSQKVSNKASNDSSDLSSLNQPTPNASESSYRVKKKPISKKKKVTTISLVVIAILVFGVHTYLQNLYSPQNQIATFEEIINEQNVEEARKLIDFSHFDTEYSDQDITEYLAFLEEHKVLILEDLQDYDPDNMDQGQVMDQNGNEIVTMVKGDKKLGIYQVYVFKAIPFEIRVDSNLNGVDIALRENTETKGEDILILSSVLPGSLEMNATFTGEYTNLEQNTTVSFLDATNNSLDVYMDLAAKYVQVFSNDGNGVLFVNGKSMGESIGGMFELGPVPVDGSIVLHAEYQSDNGLIKTNEVKVMSTEDAYLEFNEQDLYPQEQVATTNTNSVSIEDFMNQYVNMSVSAINEREFSLVESFHHEDGLSYNESKEYIDYIESIGITEDMISVEVLDYEQEGQFFYVYTEEVYDIHYGDGTTSRKKFASTYKIGINEEEVYQVWSLEETKEI